MNQKKIQKRQAEIVAELRKDQKFVDILSAYSDSSFDLFVERYAEEKATLELDGNYFEKLQKDSTHKLMKSAEECIEDIQCKKLFNLECLWRAEQIDLPGVEVSYDFVVMSHDILAQKILDPVTEDEVELYREYLQSTYAQYDPFFFASYPDYEFIKKAYQGEDEHDQISGYLEFYMQRTGTSNYLLLPNIRGEKEEFYAELWAEADLKDVKPKNAKPSKPSLSSNEKSIAKIASQLGDKKLANFVRAYEGNIPLSHISIKWAYYYLTLVDEYVQVKPPAEWKDAIYDAAANHSCRRLVDILPQAWQAYNKKSKLNLYKIKKNKYLIDVRKAEIEQILNGRELNGEPRDLNF